MIDSDEQDTPASSSEAPSTEAKPGPGKVKTEAQRAAAARKRARRMAKLRPADEVAEELYQRFPKTFIRESRQRRPLAIGLHMQLMEATKGDYHRLEIQRFLSNYAHSLGYLHGVVDRRPRVDLNGDDTGEVIDDEMVSAARTEIDQIQERRAARGDGPKRGPIARGGPKPKQKRPTRTGGPGRGPRREGDSARDELLGQASGGRPPRQAKIISKKTRRVSSPTPPTLMSQKLADAGLGNAPRKKLVLQKKSSDESSDTE